jgi:hypothetical protein
MSIQVCSFKDPGKKVSERKNIGGAQSQEKTAN